MKDRTRTTQAPVAQTVERLPRKQRVGSSSLSGGSSFISSLSYDGGDLMSEPWLTAIAQPRPR